MLELSNATGVTTPECLEESEKLTTTTLHALTASISRTTWVSWYQTGKTSLMPNQQCQSTEGTNSWGKKVSKFHSGWRMVTVDGGVLG